MRRFPSFSAIRRLPMAVMIAVFIILPSIVLPFFYSCSGGNSGGTPVPVTVSYSPFEPTALMWIALDQRHFESNGLDIKLRKYDTGAGALAGLMDGEANIAMGVTEFPVVRRAFQKEKIAIVADSDRGKFIYIIGRNDRNIKNPRDLRDKKIGVARGTIAEFYLGRFLGLNGIKMQDINLVDLQTPAQWVDSVVNGDVDAVATAQPDANTARNRLGANGFFWPAQSGQDLHGLIVTQDHQAKGNLPLVARFLKSIAQAEEFAVKYPSISKNILQQALNLAPGYVETVWSQNEFVLSLEQPLILAMEDEARWMISNKLTAEKTVPNFLDIIYTEGLKSVKPGSVHIPGK